MFWRDPNTHNIGCYAPLEDIARVKTLIKGRTVPNKFATRGAASKEFSKMSVSDFYIMTVHNVVRDVEPDAESLEWAAKMLEKHKKDYDVPLDYGKNGRRSKRRKNTSNETRTKRK